MALYHYPAITLVVIDTEGNRYYTPGETIEFYNITQDVSITSIVADSVGSIDAGSLNSASEPVNLYDVVELRHATYNGTARIVLQASAEAAANAVENHVASLVLESNYTDQTPDAAVVIAEDLTEPGLAPVILGTIPIGTNAPIPFTGITGHTYRIYVARQHRDFDFHAADLEHFSHQDLFIEDSGSSDTPPTFTSVAYDSANSEVDLVFSKNGTATGNIQVEYKLTTDSIWTTHGTTFAHGATSGSVVITEQPTALTYDIRLKQVGVAGYSVIRQVTVDASGSGTPPSDLQAFETFVSSPPDTYDVQLDWTAGSGAGNYTIERKTGSGGSWTVLTSSEAASPYTDSGIAAQTTGKTYYYRVKQNDVTGYSNEAFVYIPRDES